MENINNPDTSFLNFISSEKDLDRLEHLDYLLQCSSSWKKNIYLWQILSLIPTKLEKNRLVSQLKLPCYPCSEWTVATCLINDPDQDVVGNAINSLTFSKCRPLGHRALKLFLSGKQLPQRVLYCLARYAEESIDRRFAPYISPNLSADLSDAFLARCFNALFTLGVKDDHALEVACNLLESHINATNMDRKAAVAAIVYLFFAGKKEHFERLVKVRNLVGIPELRRLLNWGFAEINLLDKSKFDIEAAQIFFSLALNEEEPNFTGYGLFEESILNEGLIKYLSKLPLENWHAITRCILALGNNSCIDILALDKNFGLQNISKTNNKDILDLWRKYLPINSKVFTDFAHKIENFKLLHADNPEILFTLFQVDNYVKSDYSCTELQNLFEKLLTKDFNSALNILCSQILALEKETARPIFPPNTELIECLANLVITNLKKCVDFFKGGKGKNIDQNSFIEHIYGLCVGGDFQRKFYSDIARFVPFALETWAFNGVALYAPSLEQHLIVEAIVRTFVDINKALQEGKVDRDEFILQVVSRLQAIIIGTERFKAVIPSSILKSINEIVYRIQNIFHAVDTPSDAPPEEGEDNEGADWSGHVSSDKPILRWNAVLQACFNGNLSPEDSERIEQILLESMRVAPHVEKRWVVRALVKLGSDDAIKTILYQAFQHIDSEFVAHSIRELLPSKHPRAQQALIRSVGRNTIPDELKLQILDEISLENPEDILKELRTLEILRLPQHIDDAVHEAVGRVAAIIDIEAFESKARESVNKLPQIDVDIIIKKFVYFSDSLSVEVKSALRTAEMIYIQSQEWGTDALDLSPIVNMHFKAVELIMREVFEPFTDAILRKGSLSHKLDLLGYARPIPEKMQLFEDYLANLPTIKSIPYFSKFKLRKMLRAICLFRPGKRFTLDGPKAFALLFLAISRKTCSFGLENCFDLGFKNDNDLFEFVKTVHSLQDSRNRAVHEGLTWEAKDEIENMRSQAYKIVEYCLNSQKYLQQVEQKRLLSNLQLVSLESK